MSKKPLVLSVALVAALLAACGGRGVGNSGSDMSMTSMLPAIEPDLMVTAALPARTVGEELPTEGVGAIKMLKWKATVGGFTQTNRAQTLAFPPGTKITVRNMSKTTPHTFNVVKEIAGPPADFPANPSLSTTKHGNGILAADYASGIINPGKTVTVMLSKAGTYLIGCAYHYSEGMRDVIVIQKNAKPGPQASPSPKPKSTPTSGPTSAPTGSGGW